MTVARCSCAFLFVVLATTSARADVGVEVGAGVQRYSTGFGRPNKDTLPSVQLGVQYGLSPRWRLAGELRHIFFGDDAVRDKQTASYSDLWIGPRFDQPAGAVSLFAAPGLVFGIKADGQGDAMTTWGTTGGVGARAGVVVQITPRVASTVALSWSYGIGDEDGAEMFSGAQLFVSAQL